MKGLHTFFFLTTLITSALAQPSLYKENGKVGLKNEKGEILIPAQFDALGWSNGTFSLIDKVTGYQSKGMWGLININNHFITKPEYTGLVPGEALMLVAYKKANYAAQSSAGCILTSGKEIIPFEYDGLKISSFRAIAFKKISNQVRYGLIDLTNKKLIPMEYKSIYSIGSLRFAVENFQDKTALYAETGKQITDFSIDSISAFYKNYAVIHQDLHQGLMDRDGQIKIQPIYRAIKVNEDGSIQAHMPDEWLMLNHNNQQLHQVFADSIEGLEKNLFKLRTAGYIQLVDATFKPISPQRFSSIDKFENGKAIFGRGKKFGVVRKNGTILIEPLYSKVIAGDKYYIVNQTNNAKGQWLLLDSTGAKKHTRLYERMENFNGKFFPVKNKNFWGGLDLQGREIIACVHDSLLQTHGDFIVVKFRGQYGMMDTKENWIVTPQQHRLRIIATDRYLEMTDQNTFLKSFDGTVIYFTSNKIDVVSNYLQEHLSTGGMWEIDMNGRILSKLLQEPESIQKIFSESEGLKAIKKDGKFGFIDARGRLRIANRYENALPFSQQLAAIKIRGRWGFISHEDKIAIQPVYEEVTPFENGFSIVKQKSLYGTINREGKVVVPIRYERLAMLPNGRMLLSQDGLQGLADERGKILLNCKYTSVQDLGNGYIIVAKDKRYSLLTLQGLSAIPMVYDFIGYDQFNDRYTALKKSEWKIVSP